MKDKPVILVVDDKPQNIDLLEAYLVPQGYEIVKATNGEDALEELSNNQIDLVLLDIVMPGIDGFEVTRRIRQNNTLPIILVTALRETEDRVKGIEAGGDDFISKPFDKLELLARVRSLLRVKVSNDLIRNYLKDLQAAKISTDEAREYAENIINTVREPLLALDQDLRVVSVSRSFYDFFKVTPEETLGQLIYDLGNKQWDIPKLRELLETILPQKTTFDNYEVEHDFATIGRRIMLLNARQINNALGTGTIILLAIEDITEKQKLSDAMQRAQKLESLGVLAGGIAHDFNNLMGGIFGYIELANLKPDSSNVSNYLSKALNTIDRARALTRQMLTFAKGGAPKQKAGHLFPFVQETAQFALVGANATCHFDVAQDLWDCNFDKNQIGQVIDNLIVNAQQAMPVGGKIELTARNITRSEKEHPLLATGKYVKISVKDSGTGIQKELVSKIFDPFFTTKAKGHGLGLAICYSIVKRHNGCIDVESEMGNGSTFHIYLPASTNHCKANSD